MLYKEIEKTVSALDVNSIADDRKLVLQELINYIQSKINSKGEVLLNFICTHNSRRSQFGQIWTQVMAEYYKIPLESYSGGTEVSACHENTIQTLQKSGFEIKTIKAGENPVYTCRFSDQADPIHVFSKLHDDDSNPKEGFAAIMTCGHAEANCPFVAGCEKRIAITYEDPKEFDNTLQQEEKYMERSLQIATEMKYVFKQIEK